jgi:DNA-binding CsgD family transcriptional regulator
MEVTAALHVGATGSRVAPSDGRQVGRLLGRDTEIGSVTRWLEGVASGSGGTLIIVGDAGIGKSALLDHLDAEAGRRGVFRRRVAARHAERTRPLGPLLDAVEPTDRRALVGSTVRMSIDTGTEFMALERILDEFERASKGVTPLLVIDDLHFADIATVRCLRLVSERLALGGGGLAIASRPIPAEHHVAGVLDELAQSPSATVLHLAALGPRAAGRFVRERLAGRPPEECDARSVDAIVRSGHGNPLLMDALSRATERASDDDAMATACAALETASLEILRVASVLGTTIEPDVLALVAEVSVQVVQHTLSEAHVAGVIAIGADEVTFRHDLYREYLYGSLNPGVRRAVHLAAARLLGRLGRPSSVIAQHYAVGAFRGDLEAVAALHAAAIEIVGASPSAALPLFDAAREILGPTPPPVELLADHMQALAWSGDLSAAEALGDVVLGQTLPDPVRYRVHRELAFTAFVRGAVFDAIDHLDHAGSVAEGPVLRSRTLAERSLAVFTTADLVASREGATQALELARTCGDVPAMALATSVLGTIALLRVECDEACLAADRLEAWSTGSLAAEAAVYQSLFFAALIAFECHDDARFERVVRAGRRVAEETGTVWAIPLFDALGAFDALRACRLDDVAAIAAAGVEISARAKAFAANGWCMGLWAQAALLGGSFAEGVELTERAEAEYGGPQSQFGPEQTALARAKVLEIMGDRIAACEHLRATWDFIRAIEFAMPRHWVVAELARLAVLTDNSALAAEVAADADAIATRSGLAGLRATAARAAAWATRDPDAMSAAAELLDRSGMILAGALARRDVAELAGLAGDVGRARAAAEKAVRRLSELGADAESDRVSAQFLSPRRGRRANVGWDALTAAQQRVARLIADGRSNPEIADVLFVSRRTVESHVAAILRTMVVKTRAELIAALHRLDLE